MLEELLGDQKDNLIKIVIDKLGVSGDQAGGFIGKLLPMAEGLIGDGKLDPSALLKGDVSSLVSGLDMESLGSALGGGREEGEAGVKAVAGPIGEVLDGMDDPMEMLGNLMGGGDNADLMSKAKAGLGKLFG